MINGSKFSRKVGTKEGTASKYTSLQGVLLFYVHLSLLSNIQKYKCHLMILNLQISNLIFH